MLYPPSRMHLRRTRPLPPTLDLFGPLCHVPLGDCVDDSVTPVRITLPKVRLRGNAARHQAHVVEGGKARADDSNVGAPERR